MTPCRDQSPGEAGDAYDIVVLDVLAKYLRRSPGTIRSSDCLCELGLESFDLSIIALRLERSALRSFPLSVLALVETVEQFVSLVRAWSTARGGSRLDAVLLRSA